MAVINLRTGEQIAYGDGGMPDSSASTGQALADSVALIMGSRERQDYVWANAAQRTAQTGMREGARGRQADTKTEWLYENGQWRLALPYAEFTASVSIAAATGAHEQLGVFSVDSGKSTDTTFAVPFTSGRITLVNAGIYSLSTVTEIGAPASGRTFLQVSLGADPLQRTSIIAGEDVGSQAVPNVYAPAGGTYLDFAVFKVTPGTTTVITRARITRIG